jgi:hypothetical protein
MTRRGALVVGVALATLAASSRPAAAEFYADQKAKADIAECVRVVRAQNPYSRFDAYLATESPRVRYFGLPVENFPFEKCMEEQGTPLFEPLRTP